MTHTSETTQKIADAFDKEASAYRDKFEIPKVPAVLRQIVHQHLARYIKSGDRVLDMNCGPGPDFRFLRTLGAKVTGLDVSPEMLSLARKRAIDEALILLDYNQLHSLEIQFDVLLSNFGGLNTQNEFTGFAEKCWKCLVPNGWFIVNIMTPFPLMEVWEGIRSRSHFFRRLRQKMSSRVAVGELEIMVYYFWPKRFYKQFFSSHFHLEDLVGLGVCLPPPYGRFSHQGISGFRQKLENTLASRFPFRSLGDHALLVMRARSAGDLDL